MKKSITEASFNQLMAFAKASQLEITRGINQAGLITLIQTAMPTLTEIEVADETLAIEIKNLETGKLSTHYRDDPKVEITIKGDKDTGMYPMTFCVGSDHVTVRRNERVKLPYRFFHVIENAVEEQRTQQYDPMNLIYVETSHETPTINYNVHSMPSDEEIAAWHERTKDIGRGDDAMIEYKKMSSIGRLLADAS